MLRINLYLQNVIYFIIFFFLPIVGYSQVSVLKSEFMQVFSPGSSLYVVVGESQTIDIGNTGGPNAYDFTFVDMQNKIIMNNYEVGQISGLASRFPSAGITFGFNQEGIDENPVFLSRNDSTYVVGSVSVGNENRVVHFRPYELFFRFPISYGDQFMQNIDVTDTTFDQNWQVQSTDFGNYHLTVKIDGYGTLKLPNMDLECLRVVRYYSWYQYKEFYYITKEGLFVVVPDVSVDAPDTGEIIAEYNILSHSDFVDMNDTEKQIPSVFRLEQNYPNPFNPSTTIKYSVPAVVGNKHAYSLQGNIVTLKIYDILGREVATLVNERQQPGYYEVQFDASDLNSGVYFYSMKAGSFFQTRKLVLVK